MPKFLVALSILILLPAILKAQNKAPEQVLSEVSVYFDFGKSELKNEAVDTLRSVLQKMEADSSTVLSVIAHTDSIGSYEANLKLSEARALQVIRFFTQKGISPGRLQIDFKGEYEPLSSNHSEQGRKLNRRATLVLLKPVPEEQPLGFLKGRITDNNGNPLLAEVMLKLSGKEPRIVSSDSLTGRFAIPFFKEELSVSIVEVYAPGFFFHEQIADLFKAPSLVLKVKLKKAEEGEKIALNKLYFVGNEATLLPPSVPELKRLLRFMQINDTLSIEIGGHVNHPFTKPENLPRWSFDLSVLRAKIVFEYLEQNGIMPERMRFKGYGNSEMIYPETRLESEMKLNRRVEIKVIGRDKQ